MQERKLDNSGSKLDTQAESSAAQQNRHARIMAPLAELNPDTPLDKNGLACAMGLAPRTIKRLETLGQIPPSFILAGRPTWLAGKVIDYLKSRAEQAAKNGQK